MDRHGNDNTRAVLPRHPSGETRTSTASSSFSHQVLSWPQSLRQEFGDEYAHSAWGPDLGLAAASTLASLIHTLVRRWPIQRPNGSWGWRCRGRYLNGSLSGLITDSECLDSFTPLPLDVFHALWELYYPPLHKLRPAAKSTSCEHFAADQSRALVEVPIGTSVVRREFTDQQGRT